MFKAFKIDFAEIDRRLKSTEQNLDKIVKLLNEILKELQHGRLSK